jgi:hypothetical protein
LVLHDRDIFGPGNCNTWLVTITIMINMLMPVHWKGLRI